MAPEGRLFLSSLVDVLLSLTRSSCRPPTFLHHFLRDGFSEVPVRHCPTHHRTWRHCAARSRVGVGTRLIASFFFFFFFLLVSLYNVPLLGFVFFFSLSLYHSVRTGGSNWSSSQPTVDADSEPYSFTGSALELTRVGAFIVSQAGTSEQKVWSGVQVHWRAVCTES